MAPPANSVHTPKAGRWNRARTIDFNVQASLQNAQMSAESATPSKRSQPLSWRSKSVELHSHSSPLPEEKDIGDSIMQVISETPTCSCRCAIRRSRRSATWGMIHHANAVSEAWQGLDLHGQEQEDVASDISHSQASDENSVRELDASWTAMTAHTAHTAHSSLSSCSANAEILSDDVLAASLSSSANSLDSFLGMTSSPPTYGQMLLEDQLKDVDHQKVEHQIQEVFYLDTKIRQQEQKLQKHAMKLKQRKQVLADKRRAIDANMAKIAFEQGGGPKNWGISVQQLVNFCDEIKPKLRRYCVDHRLDPNTFTHVCLQSPCPHHHGCVNCRALHSHEDMTRLPNVEPNMHTVVGLFIKPLTKDCHGGLRGLALTKNSAQPKQVQKFISHSWTGRFEDLVGTLSRKLLPETVVFICSFALPQNIDLNAMLATDLESTPFALAHELACEVWLVIDESVEVISRAWVIYELYLSLARKKPLQIALTETGAGFHEKIMRQLPSIDVRQSKASKPVDLKAITTTLAGKEDELNEAIKIKLKEGVHQQHAEREHARSEVLRDTTNFNRETACL